MFYLSSRLKLCTELKKESTKRMYLKHKVAREWTLLRNEELHNSYSPDRHIFNVFQSRKLNKAVKIDRQGEIRNAYKILLENTKE
jgi:hypothetical protein